MSDKPSLYVVEKKEVIILVVLFVLVTVLSFTLGVRYGESVGRKTAHEQELAAKEVGGEGAGHGAGTLGKEGEHGAAAEKHDEAKGEHGEAHDEHGEAAHDEHGKDEHAAKDEHGKAEHGKDEHAKSEHGEAAHDEHGEHGEKAEAPKGDAHSPEEAAKGTHAPGGSREAVDKNSDEYLLNALKDAGVEPPGGKAPKEAKLPDEVKAPAAHPTAKAKSGSYVIQVGSHPTRAEAESQVKTLRARKVQAEVLAPFKDKQGEWHRVVISGFKSKHEAEKEAGGLKGRGSILSYFVWRLP